MNAIDRLIEADRKTPKTIIVVGDGMQDKYVHGRLSIGQEDCPKFVAHTTVTVAGGAANAYASLERWSENHFLCASHDSKKTRFIVNGKTIFRFDQDIPPDPPFKSIKNSMINKVEPDAILISDYDKGFLSAEAIREIIDYANERGIPCVADAKREPEIYQGAILKCNDIYFNRFYDSAKKNRNLIVTQGSNRPVVRDEKEWKKVINQQPIECVNHVGAGDCFAAHLTLALAHGLSLEDAATIAHSAGRIYVQNLHNRAPYPHEIRRDIDPCLGKVVVRSTLTALRESIPGKIVFANGCFDLFGPHHLYLLNEAKKHGNALVVGVNSDESVKYLKGIGRPVIPQEQRAMLIAGLEAVDWVVVFDENTPAKAMELLKPDVRAVCDIKTRCVDGDQFAKSIVKIAPLEGWSTTHTMMKIQNSPR